MAHGAQSNLGSGDDKSLVDRKESFPGFGAD